MKRIIQRIVTLALLISSGIISKSYSADMPVIPQDENMHHYSAIVGLDEEGNWQPITVKQIEGATGTFILNLGTISATIETSVWEAQPTIRYAPFEYTISALGTYSLLVDFIGSTPGWILTIEYITLFRDEIYPIDYLSLALYVKAFWDENIYLILAEELSPGSSGIIKPPKPIGFKDYMRLDLQNKSEGSQKIKGVIVYSYRKYNYAP
ncbi:MAG: hypothetical protein AB1567_04485 [bacterium]